MLDPDNFHEGDKQDIIQAKRHALTMDINLKYTPLIQEVLQRPYDDPTRLKDYEELISKMKEEMDQRFTEATRKPVIKPLKARKQFDKKSGKLRKDGHFLKGRGVGAPNMDLYNIGVEGIVGVCARPGCENSFVQSKDRKKYCCNGCEERAKRDRFYAKAKQREIKKE